MMRPAQNCGHPERSEEPALALPSTPPMAKDLSIETGVHHGSRLGSGLRRISNFTLIQAHSLYKAALSPFLHSAGLTGSCRFQPTCSEYSTLALAQHGLVRGSWLSLARLLRCHPFARGGWDPVPPPARRIDASK